GRVPLLLVTGFLGSGKTTFLREVARQCAGRRLAFLVNDFAAVDVDAQALSDVEGEMFSVPGGSIFCRCLTTTFTKTLKGIAALEPPVEGVIVEASGMADPRCVGTLLAETGLDAAFSLSTVVALADPGTFPKLLKTLPSVRSQVECADIVLLNKTDLFDEATIAATEAALHLLRDDVTVIRCVKGNAPVRFFVGQSHAMAFRAEPSPCRDASFVSATVRFRAPRRLAAVIETLNRYGDILWRAKGHLLTEAGMMELQWTMHSSACCGAVDVRPAARAVTHSDLALIARGDASSRLDALVDALKRLNR
ncbi:MAG: hypothetical protein FWF84_02095, partial [Kiritimatiellaeota bacterium]|nr:hypothetical protein [Kiritimatiellota bacterium]